MQAQSHRSDPRILDRRTLARDHRRLAALLRPGLTVLDVGCGTGAITAGIAAAVAPGGRVLGIDRDAALLAIARDRYAGIPNLEFLLRDVLSLDVEQQFDIVTAARTLQWIGRPRLALARMCAALKSGGWLITLDYNHSQNAWSPEPPRSFRFFYDALLRWRAANQWDNEIADHVPAWLAELGLEDILVFCEDEIALHGEPGFGNAAALWLHVIETLGPQIVAAGFLSEPDLITASKAFQNWALTQMRSQTLVLRAVQGQVP